MCTALCSYGNFHLFGRTLDIEGSYGESVVITPRGFDMTFIHEGRLSTHLAMLGIAIVKGGIPLYYDAVNEAGLAMAGLNFPISCVYSDKKPDMKNISSFELIPWVLFQCKSTAEAIRLLSNTNITNDSFSDSLPTSPLHWIISDSTSSAVVESVSGGIRIYENPLGVLTNEPPFPYHEANICNFLQLGSHTPKNNLCPDINLTLYSRGLGAVGLPGDYSSQSRFVRAVFSESHTAKENDEIESVCRFFHIMDTVSVPLGAVKTSEGKNVFTLYTSCASTKTKTYYFTTYSSRHIKAVRLVPEAFDLRGLSVFPIAQDREIHQINF